MFSNKTILEIIKSINLNTHDEVDRFGIEFDIEAETLGVSINKRETSIVKYLLSNPESCGPNGSNLAVEILEYSINNYRGCDSFSEKNSVLARALERDGFEICDDKIRKILPSSLPIVKQEDQLINLLEKFNLSTAKGHYEQAIAAHARGEWAAANAQLRSFVEEIFNKIQNIICPGEYSSSNERKIALAQNGFFIKEYNEYLSNGTGFVEGFWKRLHPEGSHPGLSEQSDSTFRLHLVILVMHHYLARVELMKA